MMTWFGTDRSDGRRSGGRRHSRSFWIGVEQQKRLEMSASAFVYDVLPVGPNLTDGCVVKVNPQLKFRVEKEGGIMFAVVCDDAHQTVGGQLCPA